MTDKLRTIIVEPKISDSEINDFSQLLFESGINNIFMHDMPDSDALSKFETYSFSGKSDVQVVDSKTLNKVNLSLIHI